MRVFFSVGEPSGDLHASNLMKRLTSLNNSIETVGFGGPKMEEAGCELLVDLTAKAVMFFWDAIKNYPFFKRLLNQADEYFKNNPVDAVVLIDYPGFNWNIARIAKKHGIPVYYYGVPQMWAWAPWRIRKIRKYVDHVLCKLPFEVEWFRQRGCHATYVGHPYFDQLEQQVYDEPFIESMNVQAGSEPLLVLLPGSRDREVERHLPLMIRTVEKVRKEKSIPIAIACYNKRQRDQAVELLKAEAVDLKDFPLFVGRTPELMRSADVCLACSGSVSLELMYHRKPTVILYRIGPVMYFLQSIFLQTKYITLVNLIASNDISDTSWRTFDPDAEGAEAVPMPEYLTKKDPSSRVAKRLLRLFRQPELRESQTQWLDELSKRYAKAGASNRAADYILESLGLVGKNRDVDSNSLLADPVVGCSKPSSIPERAA